MLMTEIVINYCAVKLMLMYIAWQRQTCLKIVSLFRPTHFVVIFLFFSQHGHLYSSKSQSRFGERSFAVAGP